MSDELIGLVVVAVIVGLFLYGFLDGLLGKEDESDLVFRLEPPESDEVITGKVTKEIRLYLRRLAHGLSGYQEKLKKTTNGEANGQSAPLSRVIENSDSSVELVKTLERLSPPEEMLPLHQAHIMAARQSWRILGVNCLRGCY